MYWNLKFQKVILLPTQFRTWCKTQTQRVTLNSALQNDR